MGRFVSPPIDKLDQLRQPLTKGERLVFDFFNKYLPENWEIYIQPHLNGLRPDFVLLNPNSGIAVFEVKDWDLDAMEYWVEERPDKSPILLAKKDGKRFSLQTQNPIEKVLRYKQELFELYCPRLDRKAGFAVITAGVIFPFAQDKKVKELFSRSLEYHGVDKYPEYHPISGADSIKTGSIHNIFPESLRYKSKFMNDDLAKDLRNWLIEPDFSKTQRQPLELDKNQRLLATTRTESGYRRIKGPAGSGKSLVLAARAAQLIGEGKKVLVVTFNITLLHYLMDIAVRWPSSSGKTRKDVTWLNFHFWCKRVCQESDHEKEYKQLWRNDDKDNKHDTQNILNRELPELVAKMIDEDTTGQIPRYDAVLVDEGQDFLPSWWNVLRKVCRPGGEMLLVADATQDIYGTARSWTDEAMKGAGFPGGKWAELKISYRLPPTALYYARTFAEHFLPKDMIDLPESAQGELDIYPCKLKWIHTTPENALNICKKELFSMAKEADPDLLAISDITFLTGSQEFGHQVVDKIGTYGVRVVHTFGSDSKDSRKRKMGFYMGDSRIKATTLHSFKGWESRALVIFIGEKVDRKTLSLIYTGLTRLKRNIDGSYLTVVSCANELRDYGKTWPKYEDYTYRDR